MLTLYYRPTCPFCLKVLEVAEELELDLDKRDVTDPKIAEELMERGGKAQEPYLIDSDRDVEMYESTDIINYLKANYGQQVS